MKGRTKLIIIRALYKYLPVVFPLRSGSGIVVSITSYPKRFDNLYSSINSAFKQTLRPEKIVLYLDENVEKTTLPKRILDLQYKGLEIRNRPYDIKPHKKYYFALQEFCDKDVITIDDDMIYRPNTFSLLSQKSKANPNCIVARRVHYITHNKTGEVLPYKEWDFECNRIENPSNDLIALGIGAVLYPASIIPPIAFNLDLIKQLSLSNDDLWLKCIERINQIKTVKSSSKKQYPIPIEDEQESALMYENVFRNNNDECIRRLQEYFKMKF